MTTGDGFSPRVLAGITLAAVLLGCWFRLGWPLELEYKADEALMFGLAQRVGVTEPWPALGIASGAGGLRNPGLSVWVFAGLTRLTGVETPLGLARVVQGLNCLALLALVGFAWRRAWPERRLWLWAAALAALSPTGILLQRKIWAQSLLPLLCVLLLCAWWRRRTFLGALGWAMLALLAAQIHMSGFIFFVAVTLWTLACGRTSMHWRGWTAGTLIGLLPALPWLEATVRSVWSAGATGTGWLQVPGPAFWGLWATEGFGTDLRHTLGGDLAAFLREPAVLPALLGLGAIGLFFLGQLIVTVWRKRAQWRMLGRWLGSPAAETRFLLAAAVIAYGVLLSLPDLNLYRHYLLIAFPLPQVWLAAAVLAPRLHGRWWNEKMLLGVLVLNAVVVIQLFEFLRHNGGAPLGDFGPSWRVQAAAAGPALR